MTPEERFERIEKGIEDLILVAKTNLESTKTLQSAVATYIEAAEKRSKESDERLGALTMRLDALIHIVDDLVRDRWRRKNGEPER